MFHWGTSGLTKQSSAEMSRNHHVGGGGKKPSFSIFIFLILICLNPDLTHPETQSIFSPAASAPFMGNCKVAEQEEQFCNVAVSILFTVPPLLKPRIVLMFNHIKN